MIMAQYNILSHVNNYVCYTHIDTRVLIMNGKTIEWQVQF